MMIKSSELSQLPNVSAIYRVWYQGRVVYLGKAKHLKQRWKNHHIWPKLINRCGLDWEIDWVEIEPGNLDRAEAMAYREFQPERLPLLFRLSFSRQLPALT